MKFHAKISLLGRPFLWGKSDDKNFDHYVKSSCHEFSAVNVDLQEKFLVYNLSSRPVSEVPSTVTYIAGKYPEGSLHGPASSIVSKSIIYPCEEFRCQLECPCHLCRKKAPHCLKAVNCSSACGGTALIAGWTILIIFFIIRLVISCASIVRTFMRLFLNIPTQCSIKTGMTRVLLNHSKHSCTSMSGMTDFRSVLPIPLGCSCVITAHLSSRGKLT